MAEPETVLGEPEREVQPDDADIGRDSARSLLAYLEAHMERLAEGRTEMRGVRYEAESLRIEAGRGQVFAALVDADRARSTEIRAERDRLAVDLAERQRPWFARVMRAFFEACLPRRRPF